jgi:hypothetical protein
MEQILVTFGGKPSALEHTNFLPKALGMTNFPKKMPAKRANVVNRYMLTGCD